LIGEWSLGESRLKAEERKILSFPFTNPDFSKRCADPSAKIFSPLLRLAPNAAAMSSSIADDR